MTVYTFGQTVVVHRRQVTGEDSDGNDVYGDVTVEVDNCVFDPGGSTEVTQDREMVIAQPRLLAPQDADIHATDRVEVAGVLYEVDGEPAVFVSPFDGSGGTQVNLKRVTG